ncbi:uncharacterized protein FOMMEDRAFT_144593 [Fomitiporia mediterranea MF3/22]|uniref:uncharacterized protein n=1 Tax=Fomitiporia mediterranea (strain MF3/22) TaxID=694068 RepID=UPI0004407C32|nr:uncharacterized protein FOMMEDRAFT_144593 [Fomitiporia mediterranea MF3/22]EJD06629.1 hypothetical protein FOMMEDRAFT_144593 [Fomitiporia mediterranea MF3/22]
MPGRFVAPQMVRDKSSPTIQLTISDTNWQSPLQSTTAHNSNNTSRSSGSNVGSGSSDSSSKSRSVRSHGLLTPHASFYDILAVQRNNSTGNSKQSVTSTDGTSSEEVKFATPEGCVSPSEELYIPNTLLSRIPRTSFSSSGLVSYASVGVQTSLPYSTPSHISTAPPSPVSPTPSTSLTPKAKSKGKHKSVPDYIREGESQAREIDNDLRFLAREKRHLKRSLSQIKRTKRDLKSLLVSWPRANEESAGTENESDMTDKEPETSRRVLFRGHAPLTPASSEYEKEAEPSVKSSETPSVTSPTVSSSSRNTFASSSADASTPSHSSFQTAVTGTETTKSASSSSHRPEFIYGEGGSSTTSTTSTISGYEGTRQTLDMRYELAPNPVCDPSTYLVWFDLETTDAVRPASKIRILEIAVLITDKNYQQLDNGKSFLVHWPLSAQEIVQEMPQKVREMHEKSGLLAAYDKTPPKERLTLYQVERRIIKYLERHGIEADGRAVMAGAGVAFDRGMVRKHMEKLNAYFSHQIFDTTTLWVGFGILSAK